MNIPPEIATVFFELHSNLPREGPGDNDSTTRVFSLLTDLPPQPHILDVGCGPGMQTVQLAKLADGPITAVDLHPPFLEQLRQSLAAEGLSDRVTPVEADMQNLPFELEQFDLIWAEGSAYIMEFGQALRSWRSLLRPQGYLVASEITWIRPEPPIPLVEFWKHEYPGLQSLEANLSLMARTGYLPIAHFLLPAIAWWNNYYTPLENRLHRLQAKYANNNSAAEVLASHQREIDLFRQYGDYYGYVFYVGKKDDFSH